MSTQLYGSDADHLVIQTLAQNRTGTPPRTGLLPLSIPSIKGQRPTKTTTLRAFLEPEKGFNWSLWRFPSVVEVDEKIARWYQEDCRIKGQKFADVMEAGFINGKWYARWDGDHRKHLFEAANPDATEMECMIYPVDSVEIANELFVKIQKLRQKGLTPEDVQVNAYGARHAAALQLGNDLAYCGVCIKNSGEVEEGGIIPESANHSTPSVKYRLFDRSVKEAGLDQTKMACDIIVAGMRINGVKWNGEISPTLMFGLALLFKHRPSAMVNTLNKRLTSYIHDCMKTKPKQKGLVTEWAREGGDKHNKEAESLALGLARGFKNAVAGGSYGGNNNICSPLQIDALEDHLGLNKAS